VAGTSIFGEKDRKEAIHKLKTAVEVNLAKNNK